MTNEATELFQNLRQLMGALRSQGARHYQVHFTSQARALFIISQHAGMTQGELSEFLDIRPSSTSDLIRKLKNKGLINVTQDENDKRVSRLSITEKGQEHIATGANTDFDDVATELTKGLSEEELTQLNQLLAKLLAGIKDDNDTDGFNPFDHEQFHRGPHFPPFNNNHGFFNRF